MANKTVSIELELESGLANSAIESMYEDQFGNQLISVKVEDI